MTDQKTEKTFEPITTQEEFDERVKNRLAREKERWEKSSEVADLYSRIRELDEELTEARAANEAQVQAANEETEKVRREWETEKAQRAIRDHLTKIGVADEGRQARILKHVDLESVSLDDRSTITKSLVDVQHDLPELFEGKRVIGAGSGGSRKPVLEQEKPLTREEVENMSIEEQRRPGMKERIDRFLAGER